MHRAWAAAPGADAPGADGGRARRASFRPRPASDRLECPPVKRACPICGGEVAGDSPQRPFCSPRCKDIDLGRWLGEEYRISRPMAPSDLEAERLEHPDLDPDGGHEPGSSRGLDLTAPARRAWPGAWRTKLN